MGLLWLPQNFVLEQRRPDQVALAVIPWSTNIFEEPGNHPLGIVQHRPDGGLELLMRFPSGEHWTAVSALLREGEPEGEGESIRFWGLQQVGATVWIVVPSLHVEGQIHAFVVLANVPDPAPWKKD
jgi:hypothetical protein